MGRGFIAFRHKAYPLDIRQFRDPANRLLDESHHIARSDRRAKHGDTLAITALFAALFAPALFVGPFGGVLADRVERKLVVTWSYYASAAAAAGLALLTGINGAPPLWSIYVLAFILGTKLFPAGSLGWSPSSQFGTSEAVQSAISTQLRCKT